MNTTRMDVTIAHDYLAAGGIQVIVALTTGLDDGS